MAYFQFRDRRLISCNSDRVVNCLAAPVQDRVETAILCLNLLNHTRLPCSTLHSLHHHELNIWVTFCRIPSLKTCFISQGPDCSSEGVCHYVNLGQSITYFPPLIMLAVKSEFSGRFDGSAAHLNSHYLQYITEQLQLLKCVGYME